MAGKRCTQRGCPAIITDGNTRCPQHRAEQDRARGTTTQRGYGSAHRAERARWAAIARQCHHCGMAFTSRWPTATRCSPCRDTRPASGGKWITEARRVRLYERDKYRCHLCGRRTNPRSQVNSPRFPSLDHVVPRSKGGTHDDWNLLTCCFECNALRSDDDLGVLHL